MVDELIKDPLEGFQITDYDEEKQTVTITIHRLILRDPKQQQAAAQKCIEIIQHGPNVAKVHVDPREED